MFRLTNPAGESAEAICDCVRLARDVVELEVEAHHLLDHVPDSLVPDFP